MLVTLVAVTIARAVLLPTAVAQTEAWVASHTMRPAQTNLHAHLHLRFQLPSHLQQPGMSGIDATRRAHRPLVRQSLQG